MIYIMQIKYLINHVIFRQNRRSLYAAISSTQYSVLFSRIWPAVHTRSSMLSHGWGRYCAVRSNVWPSYTRPILMYQAIPNTNFAGNED
jgi:hypothetical protein